MTADPESGLAERARTGDTEALAELFRRYATQVYEVAIRLTRSGHDADDVTQNVFIGLPEALNSYTGAGDLGAVAPYAEPTHVLGGWSRRGLPDGRAPDHPSAGA